MDSIFDALDQHINDVDVEYNPDTYKDAKGGSKPVPPGTYRLVVLEAEPRTNKDKTPRLDKDDKGNLWPTIVIKKVRVVAPDHVEGREFYPYADIRTKPFERDGVEASNLIDWLRAYDASVQLGGLKAMLAKLSEFLADERELTATIGWEGYDKELADQLKRQRPDGRLTNDDYKKVRIKGKGKFDAYGIAQGTNGSEVKADYTFARFISSLGAAEARLAQPEAA